MSRQIKFRAWDKKEFLESKLVSIDFENNIAVIQQEYEEPYEAKFDDLDLDQCTGLKDANGDDIYENDLVSLDPDDPPYQVIFDEGKFEISNDDLKLIYDLGEEYMDCEIVGSVHTDPELLEAEHDTQSELSNGKVIK